jgi:hypothetical protein
VRIRIIWSPFACRWCGEERSNHGRSYVPSKGLHGWEQPTPAQIIARMKARRAAWKEAQQ